MTDSNNQFIPFALPDIGEDEINEVLDSLRSGWLTTGPKTKRFEEDFAAFAGDGTEAIAVNSATAGLHLALEAVGIGHDDEVITTPYTFTATAEVVVAPGCKYNMTDVATSMGIHQLKKAWTFQKRRAVMAARYDQAFVGLPLTLPPHAPTGDTHAWHLYVIRLSDAGGVWRVAFAFDPKRQAVLLAAADKSGSDQKRVYKKLIALADRRYDRYLLDLSAGKKRR